MITITRTFEWDMGHRVTNHDSLCKNPHGHRYKLEVTVTGPLVEKNGDAQQGMVLDFGRLKQAVNQEVVSKLDHSFMYWENDTIMRAFAEANKELRFVRVAFVPTAECIVQHLAEQLQATFGSQFAGLQLHTLALYETPNCKATWRKE